MKSVWIKDELKLRLLPTTGKKAALIERLNKAMHDKVKRYHSFAEAKAAMTKKPEPKQVTNEMKRFPTTAKWHPLKPKARSVLEPANPTFSINKPRAPTIPAKDVDFVPIEHNLDKQFDIPPFVATKEKYLFDCRKALRHDAVGKPLTRRIPLDKGCVNAAFKRKHSLSKTSRPQDFAEAFLPFKDDRKVKNHMSFQLLTRWTNLKASLASAGNLTYTDYRDFSERELRQHFGQYVLHGISPTPQVEYQFRSQTQDPVPGIDFCYTSFGPNAERWHKHFKAFL